MTIRTKRAALLAVACLFAWGCGGGSTPTGPVGPSAEEALNDLGSLLKTIDGEKKRPPANPAMLDQYEPIAMSAARGITSKDVVYVWGAGYKADGTRVVAHEKDAEAKGGLVLLENGTVKTMTADELKAAPKAGK